MTMSDKKSTPGDYWRTPPQVIDWVQKEFGSISLDACAKDKTVAVHKVFISEEMDALKVDWWQIVTKGSLIWCNPPYSNPLPWVKKCIEESKQNTVVMLLNLDPSTKWFKLIDEYADLIVPIVGGRISFLNEKGEPQKGNSKPQFFAVFSCHNWVEQQWRTVDYKEIFGGK